MGGGRELRAGERETRAEVRETLEEAWVFSMEGRGVGRSLLVVWTGRG